MTLRPDDLKRLEADAAAFTADPRSFLAEAMQCLRHRDPALALTLLVGMFGTHVDRANEQRALNDAGKWFEKRILREPEVTVDRLLLELGWLQRAGLWAWQGRWRTTAICTACATINGVLLLWLLCPTGEVAAAGARLQLVSINVHTANQRSDLLLDFLRHADADVVLLMEVDDRWMDRLAPLTGEYPHRIANARDDNFGIALFSRTALTRASIVQLGHAGVPSITAMVRFDGRDILLLGTHPLPPVTSQYAELRNDHLREIAAFVRSANLAGHRHRGSQHDSVESVLC